MSHDTTARKLFGVTLETIVRRIVRTFDAATPSDLEAGARWYDEAGELAHDLASDAGSVYHAAAVIAHLSPRTTWARNVSTATALIMHDRAEARRLGAMDALLDRAESVLTYREGDPFDTFGPTAPKTLNFARNISGDREAVTVDVWAMRVVDLDESLLGRKGAYDAMAHAYRLAARRRGVDPATMQATTWVVSRGGRAS
jgi:hypothetical protein